MGNQKMLKQLQTMMHSMQKNMKTMQVQIDTVSQTKMKENENENFIKKLKKDKAKRERDKLKETENKKDEKEKKKSKKKKKKEAIVIAPSKAKKLTAKQQLFKTWMGMVVHLPQYFELFVDAGYEDLTYVENMQLTEQDLIQIGIEKKGHRQKILQEIKKMKPKKNVVIHDDNAVGNMNADPMMPPSMNGIDDNLEFANINQSEKSGGV